MRIIRRAASRRLPAPRGLLPNPTAIVRSAQGSKASAKLRVSGNYRYDAEGGCKQAKPSHCWHEVHPVRVLEIVQ